MTRRRSEKTKATDKAYREQHRAEASARAKAWVMANPEKRKETERAYRQKNREKIAAQKKAWRKANPEKHNAANARWKINRRLKLCDFDVMLERQNGLCAICGREGAGRTQSGRLAIDHCHTSGAVRGLLCHPCNAMLGLAKDSIETLQKAIAYLDAANEQNSGGGAIRSDERGVLQYSRR